MPVAQHLTGVYSTSAGLPDNNMHNGRERREYLFRIIREATSQYYHNPPLAGHCTSGRATVEVGLMCCSSQQSPAPGTKVSGGQWLELETGI